MKRTAITFLTLLATFLMTVSASESRLFGSDRLSSTRFTCVTQDHKGYIWIATEYGLNKYDGYRFTTYLSEYGNQNTLPHNNVNWIYNDSSGRLWILTVKGLAQYDYSRDCFVHYKLPVEEQQPQPRLIRMTEDKDGNIYIGTSGYGLYVIRKGEDTPQRENRFTYNDFNDYYQNIYVDSLQRFWKQDNDGYFSCFTTNGKKPRLLLRHKTENGIPLDFMPGKKKSVVIICQNGAMVYDNHRWYNITPKDTHITIEDAICLSNGNYLIGTRNNGLYQWTANGRQLEPLNAVSSQIDIGSTCVRTLYEDRQGNLWLGCNEKGLLFIPKCTAPFKQWSLADLGIKTGSTVSAVAPDGNGGLWCSIHDGTILHFNSSGTITESHIAPPNLNFIYRDRRGEYWLCTNTSLYRFDPKSGQSTHYMSLEADFITSMTDDGRGTLFVSTEGKGLTIVDTKTRHVRQYNMYQTNDRRGYLCNNWIQAMLYDSSGLLWSGTTYGVACYDPHRDNFHRFGWHNLLPYTVCYSLLERNDHNIIIGTDYGLFLFDRKLNKTTPFPKAGAMSRTIIKSIVADRGGDFWCSTSRGLWHYQAQRDTFTAHINDNGLKSKEYIPRIGTRLPDGQIVFGNSEGLLAFHTTDITGNKTPLGSLHLTNILIGGKTVNTTTTSDGCRITSLPVSESRNFTLSYLDNTFTAEFSTFDYSDAPNVALEYKLNDDHWIPAAIGQNSLTFTHLAPGKYSLKVRAVNNGRHSPVEEYYFTVRAPWYRSTLAYILYAIVGVSLLSYVAWRFHRIRRERLAEEKMQFLINATHDIRTPLTLILSPLHKLIKNIDNPEHQGELRTIDHNARRILDLVNQILDIRKIDKQQMKLNCQPTQIVPFIYNIYKVFDSMAHERNIQFIFNHPDEVVADIDKVQFDKVIQNLLSNAFKFTPDRGTITIDVETGDMLVVRISDTGIGISESDPSRLFTRFYQSVSNQLAGREGTGIGLNLCKMIVEMHHGTITAANRNDGNDGSVFTVSIPITCSTHKKEHTPIRRKTKFKVLLVDDDAEITDYISTELADTYKFTIAYNGKEALSKLLSSETKFDIVISDILMPEMDGFMLLRSIKTNAQTSHIPVILLTNESAMGNRLKGLNHGADAFIAKPFIIDELHTQIDNILSNLQRQRGQFSGNVKQEKLAEMPDITDNDRMLMERIMKSVNKNIGESEFSVEQLAADVGLSRTQLHRRMKEMTGISTTEFIRNIRMEQAARLLKERKVNVSQVAYSLGYNSVSHFSRVFKKHFGVAPSEYK